MVLPIKPGKNGFLKKIECLNYNDEHIVAAGTLVDAVDLDPDPAVTNDTFFGTWRDLIFKNGF